MSYGWLGWRLQGGTAAVASDIDLAQGQFCAFEALDLAKSQRARTRIRAAKAAAAMSRGGLLLCHGGLDRTGNTAAIGAALALAALRNGHSIA
jgi:hypothetical protein